LGGFLLKQVGEEIFAWFKESRQNNPVYYDKDYFLFFGTQGTWHVFRNEDVKYMFSNHQIFSSEYLPKVEDNYMSKAMSSNDPPYHRKLRLLVSQAFTPKAMTDLKPWIENYVDELLDQAITDKGELEFVRDIAVPIPMQVIANMLGVPVKDHDKFKNWSFKLVKTPTTQEEAADFIGAQQEMAEYFREIIQERSANPSDDLISHLLQVELDGQKLNEDELLGFCVVLLLAGNETTTNWLSSAILTLAENPAIQERLAKNPDDISPLLEEVLRLRSPAQYQSRIATQDVQLGGQTIKKGDIVTGWLASANRDESVFPNADQVDLDRKNMDHVSFGHGIHFCLGSPLARIEAGVTIKKLLERIKNIRLTSENIELNQSTVTFSIKELPIRFDRV
jgi:cytochrome P450